MKLFFFDLDGTLLNSKKDITPGTYAALKEWHAAGNLIAISSGRPLISILDVIKTQDLACFDPYAVAFNGSQIYSCREQKNIYKKTISLDDVRTLSSIAKELCLHHHSYDDSSILTAAINREIEYYTRVVRLPVRVLPDFPDGMTDPPCKMLCIDLDKEGKLERMTSRVAERGLDSRITAIRSNPYYLELFDHTAGKGSAVPALAGLLGIDICDTLAAGDEENDISMINAAGCGVAMLNGTAAVKAAADIVTVRDNENDGLADILLNHLI